MNKKQVKQRKKAKADFYDNILNVRLRKTMEANNMKAKDLANKMNITSESVRQWTGGYSQPSIKRIVEIAKIFNVSTDYLLGNSKSPSISLTYQKITDNFGLSKTTLNKLAFWNKYATQNNNSFKFEILNFMFEDDFMDTLFDKFVLYYNSLKNNNKVENENVTQFDVEDSDIRRYAVKMTFEKFIDMSCKKFIPIKETENYEKTKIKRNYLFDVPEEDFEQYFLDEE